VVLRGLWFLALLASIPITPIRLASGWALSTMIMGSGRASSSSSPMPRRGSPSLTMDCRVIPRVAIKRSNTLARRRIRGVLIVLSLALALDEARQPRLTAIRPLN
jgi:hypothetical protein